MKTARLCLLVVVVAAGCTELSRTAEQMIVPAGPPRALTLEDYYRVQSVGSPRISPDGRWVVYTVSTRVEDDNSSTTETWLAPTDGSAEPARVRHQGRDVTQPRWSDDGKLRFTVTRGDRTSTRERDVDRPLSGSWGVGDDPDGVVSPDGAWIGWLEEVPYRDEPEPAKTDFERRHEERFEGVSFDWMYFQRDGARFPVPDPRKLPAEEIVVRLFNGGADNGDNGDTDPNDKQLTFLDLRPSNLVWHPDGQMLAFIADAEHRDERSYGRPDLWVVDLDGQATRLTNDGYTYSSLSISPDGRYLSYVRGYGTDMVIEQRLAHGGARDLFIWPLQAAGAASAIHPEIEADTIGIGSGVVAGEPINLTDNWHLMPGQPRWSPDGSFIYFTAGIGGATHLFRVPVAETVPRAGGAPAPGDSLVEQVTTGERRLGGISFDRDFRTMAYTVGRMEGPSEVYVAHIDGSGERRISHVHDRISQEIAFSSAERLQFPSADGTMIEGWLLYPYGYDADSGGSASQARYPLIVHSHGGPHSASGYGFNFKHQYFAANGYFVLQTNFRSSTGYGEAFKWATWGAWGDLDGQDVMAGVDHVIESFPVDRNRVATIGHSYGGFMSNWLITRYPDRFAAAAVGAGISNWVSDYGTADIARTKETEFYGPPWDEAARERLLRQSPLTYAGDVRTPTLFVHGEVDQRVPYEEAEQMYFAIKKQGVPAKMVIYAGQSHGIRGHWNNVHRMMTELDWFDRWLKSDKERAQAPALVEA